jgi:hypothetical protein
MSEHQIARELTAAMWTALGGDTSAVDAVEITGDASMASCYAMTDLGAASFAAAGLAISELVATSGASAPPLHVDRVLASGWFHSGTRRILPGGGRMSPFHGMSDDFPTADGRWMRFQANYPNLRAASLAAMGSTGEYEDIARIVAATNADDLEATVIAGGGACAASHTWAQWSAHPQGIAVAQEPLIDIVEAENEVAADVGWQSIPGRPLAGVRILDLTRVLAGPMATRFLAGYGAQVLRLDPAEYDEPIGIGTGDLTLGKRCARLNYKSPEGRALFLELLAQADVIVHGLRPGALEAAGLGREVRQSIRPGLVEVTLNAYGWTGPWNTRRGFDTIVQSSTGMALAGMEWAGTDKPVRWPVSILDHSTGYLMAAAVIRGLTRRVTTGAGSVSRLSLARTAALLVNAGPPPEEAAITLPLEGPLQERVFTTPAGAVRRLPWPVEVAGSPFFWERPGDPFGSSIPMWI